MERDLETVVLDWVMVVGALVTLVWLTVKDPDEIDSRSLVQIHAVIQYGSEENVRQGQARAASDAGSRGGSTSRAGDQGAAIVTEE